MIFVHCLFFMKSILVFCGILLLFACFRCILQSMSEMEAIYDLSAEMFIMTL